MQMIPYINLQLKMTFETISDYLLASMNLWPSYYLHVHNNCIKPIYVQNEQNKLINTEAWATWPSLCRRHYKYTHLKEKFCTKFKFHGNLFPRVHLTRNQLWSHFGSMWIMPLTHWGRDKMAAIFQTTFSTHFLELKYINFGYDFTEVCSQGSY